MTEFIKKVFLLNLSIDDLNSVKEDILESNRKCVILYSSIVAGGMAILLILSLFVDVLVSSRTMYEIATAAGIILLLTALGPAKSNKGLTVFCQYVLVCFLLAFGIILGTVVEPNEASASFAVLLFVAPLLFTDMPYRINAVNIVSIVIYIFAAKATQSEYMFGFNMSIIMPYGLSNLVLTHFSQKMKIERSLFAQEKKMLSERDYLTKLLNRRSFEKDVQEILAKDVNGGGYGICSFDVNNLKGVNDRYGHKAGDELLIAAANAITNTIGKFGKCYRMGGDEFGAIIEGVYPSPDELIKMLNKEASLYESTCGFKVSISSGIVEGDGKDIESLISAADNQMYQHKHEYYIASGIDRRKRSDDQ